MALTNYLLQTLICTTLFYHLGLFMRFDRLQLLAFVPPIWAVNLLSHRSGCAASARGRWNGCGVS
ncbi:inner membrane protein [Klebsiella pneumoniae]|uniref:Inner membrane protein n=1 Tax=Klebsiella pneumoniae TaxID=573 RepID=A0A377WNL1_KLEPN|nr:inner membrane protein [Klebsiella pneumoniae]